MVKLSDLSKHDRDHVLTKQLPPLEPFAWVKPDRPLREMKMAVITTAGVKEKVEGLTIKHDAAHTSVGELRPVRAGLALLARALPPKANAL